MIHILLVDDDHNDAELFKRGIEMKSRRRMAVTVARSLTEGIKAAQNMNPAIIVTDIKMPDAQGLDAVRTFIHRFEHIPLICLTGNESDSVGLEAIRLGAQNSLMKSIINGDMRALTREIIFAIERHRHRLHNGDSWRHAVEVAEVFHDVIKD